jgi:hypothetical protein
VGRGRLRASPSSLPRRPRRLGVHGRLLRARRRVVRPWRRGRGLVRRAAPRVPPRLPLPALPLRGRLRPPLLQPRPVRGLRRRHAHRRLRRRGGAHGRGQDRGLRPRHPPPPPRLGRGRGGGRRRGLGLLLVRRRLLPAQPGAARPRPVLRQGHLPRPAQGALRGARGGLVAPPGAPWPHRDGRHGRQPGPAFFFLLLLRGGRCRRRQRRRRGPGRCARSRAVDAVRVPRGRDRDDAREVGRPDAAVARQRRPPRPREPPPHRRGAHDRGRPRGGPRGRRHPHAHRRGQRGGGAQGVARRPPPRRRGVGDVPQPRRGGALGRRPPRDHLLLRRRVQARPPHHARHRLRV